ncbi:MAG: hypothetical protein J7L47_09030 [Candidatus Odinarchaeota archaeon]|nr:hypothetical protein [Candidatus Odinarchaeota archaeon]
MKGGYFSRPVLKFRDGTALTPFEGFKNGFKPYYSPTLKGVLAIVPTSIRQEFNALWKNIWGGIKKFNGLSKWVSLNAESLNFEIVELSHYDYIKAVETKLPELENFDIVLLIVPDKLMVPYDRDPYVPYKRLLSINGYPSQMIAESTVKYSFENPYVLFNIALSIFTKAGGIPWTIDVSWENILFIGIDSTQQGNKRFFALTAVYGIPKINFFWTLDTVESPSEKISSERMKKIIRNVVSTAQKSSSFPFEKIVIHRDGLIFEDELIGVREAFKEMLQSGIVSNNTKYAFVSVKKHKTPKIFKSYAKSYGTPDKGLYIIFGYEKGLVVTTGFPEFSPFSPMGKINPLDVEIADSNYEASIKDIMKEIYYLSELHFASGFRSAKLPITILFSDRIAKFAYSGVIPSRKLQETLWFL